MNSPISTPDWRSTPPSVPASTFAGGWIAYLAEREVPRKQAWTNFEEYDSK